MGQITLKDIRKSFGPVEVLKGIDLEIETGEFVVFVGPSGCGKSTLLRMIAGLDTPTSGAIEINGTDVTQASAADRGLAMVFQSYALYPHMTVRQNLAFGLQNTKMAKAEVDKRITDASTMLEIDALLSRRPGQLSGGQRQRVAIGRAIVRDPTAFLLDEPLSNLDAELRVSMRAELSALHQRIQTTMIYVTHDQVEAMTMADRIVVLRGGKIEQVATPLDLFNEPANLFVAGFIGAPAMNLFSGDVTGGQFVLNGRALTGPLQASDGKATLGIRPQHLVLSENGALSGRITLVESLGIETVLHVDMQEGGPDSDEGLIAVLPGQAALKAGDQVSFDIPGDKLHLFDADGQRATV